jgi:hypothetical protein
MRKRFLRIILITCVLAVSAGLHAQWTPVVPGIDYRYIRIESPQNDIFVTRMDRSTTSVIIDGSLANGMITQPGVAWNTETIPSQASRYDGAFGFWGRDTARYRYKVVAAVNGNGYSSANGCPDSARVVNGAIIKRTFATGTESGSMGFLYKQGSSAPTPGTPYMGGTLNLPADQTKNRISFADSTWQQFHKINDQPRADSLILYTHHYGARTPATANVTEIVVRTQNAQPLRILPWSNYTAGTAVEIRKNSSGQTPIPFDAVVIVASGTKVSPLEGKVPSVGTEVRFSAETSDSAGTDWTNLYTAIGPMWGVILRGGVKPSTSSTSYHVDLHPRTAVAYSASYIYFIVVDGRSTRSTGITLNDLADFCVTEFGATDAVNNDGGGSSTMWVNGLVKNVPSDEGNVPRAVANGLMMIQLQPKETSTAYSAGQTVYTNTPASTLNLRTGPGSNFHVIEALPHSSPLTIQSHGLAGIRTQDVSAAPGYWWKVQTGSGSEGWVSASYLSTTSGVGNWALY